MFEPLRSLFTHRQGVAWDELDVRYYTQEYVRRLLKTEAIFCEKVHKGIIVIRVGSAATEQAVRLLEFDLARELQHQATYTVRQLLVYTLA